ncbi:MAG TPA: prepilin peptidase, partial [Thermoanaerobaculia bacterium]|nr:prepilin peptidase [Thermoanaerobaculia bacterium]
MIESPALVPLLGAFSFFAGLVFGSFANVCVHRLPRGESVVSPPSRCPACGRRIAPFDNVPVLAWLWLRGRCRSCRAPISVQYPAVEMLVGVLFLASFLLFGPTPSAARGALLSFAVVVLVLTDLRDRVLPDEITFGVLLCGVVVSLVQDLAASGPRRAVLWSLAGAAVGALLLGAVRALYLAWRGVEGMGLGDVKMIAMVGALEGPAGVFTTLLLASVAGALLGIGLVAVRSVRFAFAIRGARSDDAVSAA